MSAKIKLQYILIYLCDCFLRFVELDHRLSLLIWIAILASFAVTCTLPRKSGVLAFVASVLIRMVVSLGIQPTLWILGCTMVCELFVGVNHYQCSRNKALCSYFD